VNVKMVKYIAIGVKRKSEALKEKWKAINEGFKGVRIEPFTIYGDKRPYHYDVTYQDVNPLIRTVKETKCQKE